MEASLFITVSAEELESDPKLEKLCRKQLRYALKQSGAKKIRYVREEDGSDVRIKAIGEVKEATSKKQ